MVRAWSIVCVLCLVVLAGAAPGAAADAPTAAEFYAKAVRTMSDLPQPAYVTYGLESTSAGLEVDLTTIDGGVWLLIHRGSTPDRWSLRHRTLDYESEIVNAADGKRYVSQRSFFDPTWYGAYRALRQGMLHVQNAAPPRPSPGAPTPDPGLKAIGLVSVIGPGVYDVHDRGAAACPDGGDGHAFHLTSRTPDWHHQLSDVVVELRSMRFCMMRFNASSGFGFSGIVEQHYAQVGGYWLQTGGRLEGAERVFGIAAHHGEWSYQLTDMQFPAALPAEAFAPPTPAPAQSPQPRR